MRIKGLNIGVESVSTWTVADEVHLPSDVRTTRGFIPEVRPLEEVLRRPSLDERLPALVQPEQITSELFEGSGIPDARMAAQAAFAVLAARSGGSVRTVFKEAEAILEAERALDEDVRMALTAILRG